MDALFPAPVATGVEVFAAIVSAAIYLAVAIAALARAPADIRVRTFLATALASAAPYSLTVLLWARGAQAVTRPVMLIVGLSLVSGALALFHFTQVFPWRRPWIRAHWNWLLAGYFVAPVVAGVAGWAFRSLDVAASDYVGSGSIAFGIPEALVLLVIVLPGLFVVGVVVPFAALLSLYNSWRAATAADVRAARVTTLWILISQMGGGVLTILIIPLLHLVAPTGPWVTIAAILLFAFGLLMPLAFAAGVWRFRVLDLDIDSLPGDNGGQGR
jgi:hypothetical protein